MGTRLSSYKLPSVDPAIEQAAVDIVEEPDTYFARQRTLREREAEEWVKRELNISMHRRQTSRPRVRRFLARLAPALHTPAPL
jgi:hypothetical protein